MSSALIHVFDTNCMYPTRNPRGEKHSGCSAKTGADKKCCSTATNHSRVIKEQPRFHLTVFLAELLSETL